ncbi:MAG TPA: hypothetical protein DD706_21760, partial [Nitrospiraceae bacterium]|nr:hypothetical protein [Nitrospiraceae bacterium]
GRYNFGRGKRKEWYLLIATILFVFLLGELILHTMLPPAYQPTKYGWTVGANRTATRTLQDQPGAYRTVQNEYFDHGFKRWGQLHTHRPSVLIIGDSFTEMVQVSNGEEWYAYLEKEYPYVNFFVYGGGGYGSLQEYMVLDDYIDDIDPDVVIWQFCSNDYWNNLYESDRNYYPHNNFGVRPYLVNKEIVYEIPMPLPFLRKYSRIADRILVRYDAFQKAQLQANTDSNSNNQITKMEGRKEKVPESAYRVTGEILKMARLRAGQRPFFFFSTEPITDKESLLCREAGITCIRGVSEYLESKEAEGITIGIVDDGHWNLAGNRFVGEFLIKYFKDQPNRNIFSDVGVN